MLTWMILKCEDETQSMHLLGERYVRILRWQITCIPGLIFDVCNGYPSQAVVKCIAKYSVTYDTHGYHDTALAVDHKRVSPQQAISQY